MKRKRISVVYVQCKRCDRVIATTNRSIHGADELKKRLGGICSQCTTPEEEQEMLHGIAAVILRSRQPE